jgi:phage portal protein BeeE
VTVAYGIRDGDVIALDNEKAGALTMSVPLMDYRGGGDPANLWETQPAIRTVTGEIAREVGSIPIKHYRRKDDNERERLSTSLVGQLLRNPAPGIGSARWFEQVILDLAVHDRWAALIGYDEKRDRLAFKRLPAHRVAIATNGGERVGVWFFPPDGPPTLIPLDRVVFDIAPSALPDDQQANRLTVSSRLMTLSDVADELNAVTEWRNQVLRNGARIPAVIERPVDAPKWDDPAFNRFKSGIDQYKRGGGNEGGFPILEDGMKLKAAEVFNPKDFDTAGMRNLTLLEACLLFHYPPELLGAREGTYSNVDAYREAKYRDVLGSWIVNLEQALNVGLTESKMQAADEYVELDVDAKLRGTFDAEAKAFQTATGRPWMVTNEVRAKKNLPPLPGGDELVTPLNVLVGGIANPRDTAPDDAERDDAPKALTGRA